MAIKGFNEATLGTSEIFAGINSNNSILTNVKRLINDPKTHLTKEDIESAYITLKNYTNSLSRAAMLAFEEEKIVLIYNEIRSLQPTNALPFITFNTSQGYKTYIFLDRWAKRNKEGVLSVQAPMLHDLMLGALISNKLKTNYDKLTSNQFLQSLFMETYTKFVTRILNREYSIAPDKIVWDTVTYWINKFFLLRVIRSIDLPENIEKITSKHFRAVDDIKYQEIRQIYDSANPSNVDELMELIKKSSSRMKTLDLGTFVGKWIEYYDIPAMLAIEVPEYLIFMVITLYNGNNIISITARDIVREVRNINKMQEELLKLV